MFAVVDIAGFQELVKEGDTLKVPSLEHEKGGKVVFGNVLLLIQGENLTFGAPYVAGASVEAEVIEDGRHDKIRVVRMRRRKRFRRVKGHKQGYTEITVTKIVGK
jgi:large subunit ribosomal protein L21